ncbi:helix-turn-helix domain-containing protein [Maribellus comscasis]|nr:response regulator transcription factor [Maribellus comscasis]
MKIEFCLDKIDSFLPSIARQLGLQIKNNSFALPEKLGKGFFTQAVFNSNLAITYYEINLDIPSTIIRHKSANSDILPIVFWLSNAGVTQELNTETKIIGKNTPNGIFFPSNNMETNYTFPAGIPIKNIAVYIHKTWFKKFLNPQNDYINNYILRQNNYFLFEEINFAMEEVITDIEAIFKTKVNDTLAPLNLYVDTLKLSNLFFEKILQRKSENTFVNIKPYDIQNLFKIKGIISDNYIDFPTMDYLSKESHMNERKLQKLFKQVFGESIYQFALSLKMREAKRLLQSKNYSVSEVGYLVGYSNLSHFSQKFREHVGISPKAYLTSL